MTGDCPHAAVAERGFGDADFTPSGLRRTVVPGGSLFALSYLVVRSHTASALPTVIEASIAICSIPKLSFVSTLHSHLPRVSFR
jgi:hypothetical protein